MTETKQCYGHMFPSILRLPFNRRARSKVFTVTARSCGIGVQRVDVETSIEDWQQCTECSSYATCYDLSLAKLTLESALRRSS